MPTTKDKDKRAEDQDAAVEKAFAAGTLPDEDRRTQAEKDAGVAVEDAAAAKRPKAADIHPLFQKPLHELEDDDWAQLDEIGHTYWQMVTRMLPRGSRVIWHDGLFEVFRGPGVASHGGGRTLSRALRTVNAYWGHDESGKRVEFTEGGDRLEPEVIPEPVTATNPDGTLVQTPAAPLTPPRVPTVPAVVQEAQATAPDGRPITPRA